MRALVLAGGYATRLRPISYVLPKLLFPILGKPMIYWTLDMLRNFGVDHVVLAVNYLADSLRAAIGSRYRGMEIKYSLEETPLGTAGPIKLASRTVDLDETFIAMNGDVIADIDLAKMLRKHERTKALVTDALHEVRDPTRFGVVQLDSSGGITRFVEKPTASEAPSRLVNAGIYLIEPSVLQMIPSGRKVSLEREIFPLLARDSKLGGFPFSGHWFDIGDLSDYQRVNFQLLREKTRGAVLRGRRVCLAKDTVVRRPTYFGEGSRVEGRASVGPCLLMGKDGLIRTRARVSRSILFDGVIIGEESQISGTIIGQNVTIGKRARIESGSIISPNVRIGDGVRVGRNAVIHPYKEIDLNVKPGANVM